MSKSAVIQDIPLPKSWPKYIKSAMIYVVSLAHVAMTYSRGWAANSMIRRVQLSAELDEAQNESSLLREEMRIKDARMGRIPVKKRPFYVPVERMAILELRAARGWTVSETATAFLVEPDTISSWMKRSSDQGDPLV